MKSNKISRLEYAIAALCLGTVCAALAKLLISGCVYHTKIGKYCGESAIVPMIALSAMMLLYPIYLVLRCWPQNGMAKTLKTNRKLLLVLIVLLVVVPVAIWIRGFLAVDSCLDSGGRWSEELKTCGRRNQ